MILAVKTDSAIAELRLLDTSGKIVQARDWEAGRTMAHGLLQQLSELVGDDWKQLTGLIAFQGPGSFTGLRIGITTLNTVAYAESLPIVGTLGDDWLQQGVSRLLAGETDHQVLPHYGAEPHITTRRK